MHVFHYDAAAARGKALYLVVVLKFFPYREIHEAQNSISNAIHTNTLYVVTTTNAISTILAIVSSKLSFSLSLRRRNQQF